MAGLLTLTERAVERECYFLIDVRDAEDYSDAHFEGAAHIPLTELADRAAEVPAVKIQFTICSKGGGRSAEGADLLCRLGHPDARWLDGGTTGWLNIQA
ncbi:rhodanese-like domain-containing protein [Paracoccaceae bacterium Fryx2]|nr:rhodanese-like domain-containing protein [Paracoccaceae bacterium Fryx2]